MIDIKQAEKTEKTYQKILMSAIKEFGLNGYDHTSLNTICSQYHISKGLIYYNFKSKDELYLCSVEKTLKEFVQYLKKQLLSSHSEKENIKKLLMLRQQFFEKFPSYRNIFFEAILKPPKHLTAEIRILRHEYDEFNVEVFKKMLKGLNLRKGITEDVAITYFLAYQEMFNGYFLNKNSEKMDLLSISAEHDSKLLSILDVMLYGIVSDENNNHDERDEH